MTDYSSRLLGEKNSLSDTEDSAVDKLPKMMTIREIAATGVLPEYAIRTLLFKRASCCVPYRSSPK